MRLQMTNNAHTEGGVDPRLVAQCGIALTSDVVDGIGAACRDRQPATKPFRFPHHRRPHLE
jgi:hypothetical protein